MDVLEQLRLLPDPPFVVVTSRLADERLWAEALNRGAYDVLAKPFDGTEVIRTISSAWLHWCENQDDVDRQGLTAAMSATDQLPCVL